ncbi:MAG: glycosyltransferase, partial [Akkermansiaceae bacterium]|nr:glycosyltransferase [Akkermansiaceae bacterium]
AAEAVRKSLARPGVVGGGFRRRFDHSSHFLRWTCRLASWRSRTIGWFLGDQGIFARRETFEGLGGYSQLRAFEDLDLCRRMKRCGTLRCLDLVAVSSGRRFAGGAVRQTCRDVGMTIRYLLRGKRAFADTK